MRGRDGGGFGRGRNGHERRGERGEVLRLRVPSLVRASARGEGVENGRFMKLLPRVNGGQCGFG